MTADAYSIVGMTDGRYHLLHNGRAIGSPNGYRTWDEARAAIVELETHST
jgi:hypothetical protein